MAPRITVPLYVTCEHCGQLKEVANRQLQRVQRFCSRRCGTTARVNTNLSREYQSRGGKVRASRARARLMLTISTLTPLEAFRLGYSRGLGSKHRQIRKRLALRKATAA